MYVANKGAYKKLAHIRLDEAKLLFTQGYYCGAFYLAGYSIECALKAKIAKNLRKFDIPDHKVVEKHFTHNLQDLLNQSELNAKLGRASKRNPQLSVNWDTIAGLNGWSEESRYNEDVTKAEAQKLLDAVDDPKNGILQWIEKN